MHERYLHLMRALPNSWTDRRSASQNATSEHDTPLPGAHNILSPRSSPRSSPHSPPQHDPTGTQPVPPVPSVPQGQHSSNPLKPPTYQSDSRPGPSSSDSTASRCLSKVSNASQSQRVGAKAMYRLSYDTNTDGREQEREAAAAKLREAQFNRRPHLPWDAPSLKSSPADQLTSAILDGDILGIKTVVKAKADSLTSQYWTDLTSTVLPLHRAVSGLHLHGSVPVVHSVVECLAELKCDFNGVDKRGCNPVHTAVTICALRYGTCSA